MFKLPLVLEIGDDYFLKYNYFKKKICKFESINDLIMSTKRKKAAIILSGEEVNINMVTLPKVKTHEVYNLIKNEIYYSFRSTKDLMICYTLFKENANKDEFIVFCLNTSRLSMVYNNRSAGTNITNIYVLQLCVLGYFRKKIKSKDYVFLFTYKNNLYLLYCINNILIYNNIIKACGLEENFEELVYKFIRKGKIYYESNIETIYSANVDTNKLSKLNDSSLTYKDLGTFEEKQLFNNVIRSWR